MQHVVMFSGGIGSWACAKRVAQMHGTDNMTLLFADVKGHSVNPHIGEDEDTYRFLHDAANNVGARLVVVSDGRTIWDVFAERRFLGNSRTAPCSVELKVLPTKAWLQAHCAPNTTTLYLGIDWSEAHRAERAKTANQPYAVQFPLLDKPLLDKPQMLQWAREEGLEPPRLYAFGFAHNNCGGGCVRSGISQFARLLKAMPERYAEWEAQEQNMRATLGRDVSILRRQVRGQHRKFTLMQLRQWIETQPSFEDTFDDYGACQCFV